MNKFVLNDESKINQYGFRVLNAGLDLDRFKSNPVLLDSHGYGTRAVIGRWENIQIEGSLLTADAVFDESDPVAKTIADKVKNGFLKGASLGLNPYSMDNFKSAPDGNYDLTKCEVLEASIVSIPNNANAIKLYATTQEGMQEIKDSEVPTILLMAKEITNHKSETMNKFKLSALACLAIALSADQEHDADAINSGILKLKADLDEATQKINGFEALEADKKAKLGAELVDAAIKAGKIEAPERETYIQLHASNPDLAKSVLSKLQGKGSLAGQINNPAGNPEIKSMDDFEKLTLSAQLEFRETQPDAYKSLFK
ncbi:MAG: HK97 family phage prohead protease [Weeksellaceae bacterium]